MNKRYQSYELSKVGEKTGITCERIDEDDNSGYWDKIFWTVYGIYEDGSFGSVIDFDEKDLATLFFNELEAGRVTICQ